MSNKTSGAAASGVTLADLLLVTFIILKLCGVITWSWWWVLSPLWISAGIILVIVLAAVWLTN